ncbi:hypothetical protein ASPFODRAFT_203676 [Aspergillus luchuensis CBS 106.47]|uniref:Uncharacterized protein n=1 Tax=Aspergillus luchuensis (strain CBS 106.47) TaxID=1137211 RepID=A0A1M3TWJ4_ASPLC|nr:hypothetical protein ASPFODRAFT_203676 [Aspergillus luchuensis CBS 106.47]
MRWFSPTVQAKAAIHECSNLLPRLGHKFLSCLRFNDVDDERDELTSLQPRYCSSGIDNSSASRLDHSITLGPALVAGHFIPNAIFGTFNLRAESVYLDGSCLSPPFMATVYLASVQFKLIGPIPQYTDGGVFISFTYVNARVWNIVVFVPYKIVQPRCELALSSAPLSDQQDGPAPPAPARHKTTCRFDQTCFQFI